ncbi:MADS-box protein SOC1 [Capsicum baccatum]|uniref:MADS-box protein SOC1 n=1 Tax=Capsicum baccatum TaxID=33114 RepID=A0A2G2W3R1_CAPBA|nr:MADS-box protein SOC1 [Capsicum baccatum]
MQEVIDRYKRHTKDRVQPENQAEAQNLQHMQHEAASLMKKIELLEISKRKLLGEGLQSCTLQEIQQIEKQLERSVSTIRARKTQVFKEQVERLKEKEKILTAENAKLREKFVGLQQNQTPSEDKEGEAVCTDSSEKSDVETELIIGLPESRTRRLLQN